MLDIKNLNTSIGDKNILKDISVSFKKGKIYAIMGPNGSGKSTLAAVVMGHPLYKITRKSKLKFQGKNIVDLPADKRSQMGIFMSFQSPLSLSGVNIYQFMMYALSGKSDPLTIRQNVQKYAKELKIQDELLTRSLNDGFSGGEKKKMELLQAAMLDPQLLIFDEIDTGVDVDALRAISKFMNNMKGVGKTFIVITHYNRILDYLKPDEVLVLVNGELVKRGGASLAKKIEKTGYDRL